MTWGRPPHLTTGTTVAEACLELLEGRVGHAEVRDGARLVGIVTTADLARVPEGAAEQTTLAAVLAARRPGAPRPFSPTPSDHRPYGRTARAVDPRGMTIDPRTWLEILGTETCWELLEATPVGRLAVVTENRPEIYPVNYVTEGRTVVFRTEVGSKLAALDGNPNVCFEIDGLDLADRSGWSVLLQGRAKTVGTPAELKELHALPLEFWSVGDKPNFVRITPTAVSGRRIHPHAPSA